MAVEVASYRSQPLILMLKVLTGALFFFFQNGILAKKYEKCLYCVCVWGGTQLLCG
jgi:hypothetical protein